MTHDPERPFISVIVPFSGTQAAADELSASLVRLALLDGDEILLVDNSPEPLRDPAPPLRRVRAIEERCSYYARNIGVSASKNDWILFIDGDCRPVHADMLDRFFDPPPGDRCAAVAGGVLDAPDLDGLLARHARSRRYLDQKGALSRPRPFALTANLLVRRSAWLAIGGFCETIRSGGDQDFSWRLVRAGWSLELREAAAVGHLHPQRLRPALRKFVRYGAGAAWLARRHPEAGALRPPFARGVSRALLGALVWTVVGRWERAAFKVVDGLVILAMNVGYVLENRPPASLPRVGSPKDGPVVITDTAPSPVIDEHILRARSLEALHRAAAPHAHSLRGAPVVFSEDDGHGRRALDLAWLALRRPGRLGIELARRLRSRGMSPSIADVACIARRILRSGGQSPLVAIGLEASTTCQLVGTLVGSRNGAASAANGSMPSA